MVFKKFTLEKCINILEVSKFNSLEFLNDFFFIKNLFKKIFNKKKINLKLGIDPNKNIIHLGHILLLNKIKQFKNFNFKIILIIGNFTALIGDPSFKLESRIIVKKKIISININYFLYQINYFINFKLIKIYYNIEWINILNIEDLINLLYLITLSKILYREDFKKRYTNNIKINFSELIYPILQSFDSIFIKTDIEIGGIDQKLNFIITRSIQKKFNSNGQIIILLPILIGSDGFKKMSKSENNCINFTNLEWIKNFLTLNYIIFKNYYLNFSFIKQNKLLILNKKLIKLKLIYEVFNKFLNKNYYKKILNEYKLIKTYKFKNNYILIYKLIKILNLINSYNKSIYYIKNKSIIINQFLIKNYNLLLFKGKYIIEIKKNVKIYLKFL